MKKLIIISAIILGFIVLTTPLFAQPEIDNTGITGSTIGVPKPTGIPIWLMGVNYNDAYTGISSQVFQDSILTSITLSGKSVWTVDSIGVRGALDVTGAFYPKGGIVSPITNISRTIWNLAGATHVLAVGTDVACDDGDRHFTEIYVPYTTSATGIFYLIGSVGGTDSVIVELFDIDGDLVTGAYSDTTIVGTAATFQQVPFISGAVTLNPGRYYMSAQFDGATAKYRAPLTTGVPYGAASATGAFAVYKALVPDSTWTISEGIIGGIY